MAGFDDACSKHMSTPVYSVHSGAHLREVRDRLLDFQISSLAVIDASTNELLGVVTRTDLFRHSELQLLEDRVELEVIDTTVDAVMTRAPVWVNADSPISAAARVMVRQRIHQVFVIADAGIEGVVSCRDVMALVAESRDTTPLFEIMTSPVRTIRTDQTVADAVAAMTDASIYQLVVIEDGWPCGLITQDLILGAKSPDVSAPVDSLMDPAILVMPTNAPAHRSAANAKSLRVRQIIASRGLQIAGMVSAIDFCRLAD